MDLVICFIMFLRTASKRYGMLLPARICDYIDKLGLEDDGLLSMTIVGHSAGSVVGYDFLFYIFSNYRNANDFAPNTPTSPAMTNLENRAKSGKLRLRRFVTFGSPIGSIACRSNSVLDILARGGQSDPADYGLTVNPFGTPLRNPRWINLWDKDDPIAWPVQPLMQGSEVLDIYTDVSDSVTAAHNAYWNHRDVHSWIAKYW